MTETGWYTGDQKPVRVGVYKRQPPHSPNVNFSWWNGRWWGIFSGTSIEAELCKHKASWFQNLPWCGLTEESK